MGFPIYSSEAQGDSFFFLGPRGGVDICSSRWALLPLAGGIPSVSGH